jgi:site-specific recombinase XerD
VSTTDLDPNVLNLRDFQRYLRATDKSPTTIRAYVDCGRKFADYLHGKDLAEATRSDVESFLADVLSTRKASTAATYHRDLRQLYKWMLAEGLVRSSPVANLSPPRIPESPVPVLRPEQIDRLIGICSGTGVEERRDTALIRLMLEPGGLRLSEVGKLAVDDVDLDQDVVYVLGKGRRTRAVPFGTRTGQALTRYLRERKWAPYADVPSLWLGRKGPMSTSGIAQMLRRRGRQAGITDLHPHVLRHTAAHRWFAAGGGETDAMRLFGWRSREMLGRYAASAADERAQDAARRLRLGDQF